MKFGRCAQCDRYRYLVAEQLCHTHFADERLHVGITIDGTQIPPAAIHSISSELQNQPTIHTNPEEFNKTLTITEMEMYIADEEDTPIEKFEYSEYDTNPYKNAAEDAIEWIVA